MYKKFILPCLLLLSIFISCSAGGHEFVKTGETYKPLWKESNVKFYLSKRPKKYNEIGILTIHGYSKAERFEEAKKRSPQIWR